MIHNWSYVNVQWGLIPQEARDLEERGFEIFAISSMNSEFCRIIYRKQAVSEAVSEERARIKQLQEDARSGGRYALVGPVQGVDWWQINDMEKMYAVVSVQASLPEAEKIIHYAWDQIIHEERGRKESK